MRMRRAVLIAAVVNFAVFGSWIIRANLGASLNLETLLPWWQQALAEIKEDGSYQKILIKQGFE